MTTRVSARAMRALALLIAPVLLASVLVAAGVAIVGPPDRAAALSGSSFDPGNIISDANFFDANAMAESEIQAFLSARIGSCLNSNCLNVLRTDTTTRPASATCAQYTGAAGELASTILYKVQKSCGISAKVLLVLLQKEQGLVTHRSPTPGRIDRAMGFGCPDNTAIPGYCDPAFGGLYNQVYLAAAQFKRYGNPPGTSNHFTWFPVGGVSNIQFHPNAACGTSPVVIRNKATAALYYYTPYQPNAASLANLRGTGDGCSSYGNRNFWVFYSDWFGTPTQPAGTPAGEVKEIWATNNRISLWGWALDQDILTQPIAIHIVANGVWSVLTANAENPSTETLYPGSGTKHGFGGTIPVAAGRQNICVYAVNQGPGINQTLGCWDLDVPDGSPRAAQTTVSAAPNGILMSGWAVDPDVPAGTVAIHISIDEAWAVLKADTPNPAGEAAVPGSGPNHGYSAVVPAAVGAHYVCSYAVNVQAGGNVALGCQTVVVASGSPVGRIGDVWATPKTISLWGWALDPDVVDPIQIHVSVDNTWAVFPGNAPNPIVGAYYPAYGPNHGFGGTIAASPGAHRVCTYAVNVASGANTTLDCRTVIVPSGSPIGTTAEVWTTPGAVNLWGWALDPDVVDPIQVHVLVDKAWTVLTANAPNPGVGEWYPVYGPNHGFGGSIAVPPGRHSVCAYAVNVGGGSNTTLSCSIVQVP